MSGTTTFKIYVPGRVDAKTGLLASNEEGVAYSIVNFSVLVDDHGHVSVELNDEDTYAAPGTRFLW